MPGRPGYVGLLTGHGQGPNASAVGKMMSVTASRIAMQLQLVVLGSITSVHGLRGTPGGSGVEGQADEEVSINAFASEWDQ
jgi:hypothetical protein